MSRPMDTYDYISIVEIVVYTIFLLVGIFLCVKHGASRSSGWLFLVILSLARIVGSGLRLATISDPTNEGLYIGWQTTNGLGLGPLVLMLLGLLGRLFTSINRQQVIVKPTWQRLLGLLMIIAVILTVTGGTMSDYNSDGSIDYSTISKAGIVIMIVVLVLVGLVALTAFLHQGYIAQGEHRILIAVVASLPFVAVRLVYSCVLVLGDIHGSAWLFLGAGFLMEVIVVIICEITGLTLAKAPRVEKVPSSDQEMGQEMGGRFDRY